MINVAILLKHDSLYQTFLIFFSVFVLYFLMVGLLLQYVALFQSRETS